MNDASINRRPRRRFPVYSSDACPAANCVLCQSMARISPTLQEFIADRAERMRADVGEQVPVGALRDGAVATVAAGMIVVQKILDDGRRFVIDFVCPGETLSNGHMSKDVTAFAAIPSIVCILAPDLVSTMKRAYPQAAVNLYDLALSERDRSVEHMTTLARGTVEEKMAFLLYNLAGRTGRRVQGGVEVDLPMTRGDIADYLGLNTETVSRQFSALKKAGVIELPKPDRMIVPDLAPLHSMSAIPAQASGAA